MMVNPSTRSSTWIVDLQIRHATEADLPYLEWEGEYRHFRRLYREVYSGAQQGRSIIWIAEKTGGYLIGQLFVQLTSGRVELADGKTRAYIYGFRVRLPYRNQGIGSSLLDTVEEDLHRRGFHWVTLNVGRDNPDARRLYERRGYRVVAPEPGRWSYVDEEGVRHEVLEPAWRMEKRLRNEI